MKYWKFFLLSLGIIVLDQAVKMIVHFNMDYGSVGQIRLIGDWFKLHYTLNPGMAFGLQLGSSYGKLILSVFRLFAMAGIAYYLYTLIKKNAPQGLLWCIAMIFGGAVGNVVDSTFYGVFLENAPENAPTPWFHGQVIDMFYFDIWEGFVADWVPFLGGQYYSLWPIFNIADASIFCGVAVILIFQSKFFKKDSPEKEEELTSSENKL